ncbi:MAG TPA: hypothetical protein EYP21_04440 [Syntrophaceae bacterium]|nr:hypothetical protein [Syntrophaceae bacterium]
MIDLLKELGFSPEVIGIDQVEEGVKLSKYRVIVVPTYSLDIDNALESEKVKEEIKDATKAGTNWILFNSGSKVLEVLGLATTKINPPPGWVPALPDSFYVVNATTNSPITSGVPGMPDWPGGYTLDQLDHLMLDSLIWRVDNTESSRYKWLVIDSIIKEPTYLIYEGSTGWEISKPHKQLPEWVVGNSRILYYRHFWNADPGNGGGGTIGLAGKTLLKNAISYYGSIEKEQPLAKPKGWLHSGYDLNNTRFYPYPSKTKVDSFEVVWTSPKKGRILTGDINGDGELELISAFGERVYAMDKNGILLWSKNVSTDSGIAGANVNSLDLDDVDGDGAVDVIVGVSPKKSYVKNQMRILFYNGNGDLLKTITTVESKQISSVKSIFSITSLLFTSFSFI